MCPPPPPHTHTPLSHFGRNSAPPGGFRDFFGLIGTSLRNFRIVTTFGGVSQIFRQFAIYCVTGFGEFKPGLNHIFPAGSRFGRNSAPQGIFRYFFGPLEPCLRCATFEHFALSMVRPPAVAIRDLLDFTGLYWKFRGGPGPKLAKTTKKQLDIPGLGGHPGQNPHQPNLIAG